VVSDRVPALVGVLETVLYYTDEQATARFYGQVLGLRLLDHDPGRSLFYRAGGSVFLLFDARASARGGTLPAHGASGSIHTCLQAQAGTYAAWKAWIARAGIPVLHEREWPSGRSFYFRDPSGNLLEIADRDIWPS
jgi:catechol 2,3-dioxygenase-like lactoylglutathione lyase family enzyme